MQSLIQHLFIGASLCWIFVNANTNGIPIGKSSMVKKENTSLPLTDPNTVYAPEFSILKINRHTSRSIEEPPFELKIKDNKKDKRDFGDEQNLLFTDTHRSRNARNSETLLAQEETLYRHIVDEKFGGDRKKGTKSTGQGQIFGVKGKGQPMFGNTKVIGGLIRFPEDSSGAAMSYARGAMANGNKKGYGNILFGKRGNLKNNYNKSYSGMMAYTLPVPFLKNGNGNAKRGNQYIINYARGNVALKEIWK